MPDGQFIIEADKSVAEVVDRLLETAKGRGMTPEKAVNTIVAVLTLNAFQPMLALSASDVEAAIRAYRQVLRHVLPDAWRSDA